MATKTFVPGTVIDSPWLNDVDAAVYEILGDGTNPAATKAAARTNLGLGTMATQDANAVAITGGTVGGTTVVAGSTVSGNISGNAANVTGTVAVANGGTGATTAATARTNLGFTSAVIDRAYAETTTTSAFTVIIPPDNTIPQNTEGTQLLSATITPKTTTNRVRVRFACFAGVAVAPENVIAALFVGSGVNAVQVVSATVTTNQFLLPLVLEFEHVPGVTSATTYSIRVGPGSATTMTVNGSPATPRFGGAARATLVLEEIAV